MCRASFQLQSVAAASLRDFGFLRRFSHINIVRTATIPDNEDTINYSVPECV